MRFELDYNDNFHCVDDMFFLYNDDYITDEQNVYTHIHIHIYCDKEI